MTIQTFLIIPPIAFLIVLIAMAVQMAGLKLFSADVKEDKDASGRRKAYACGEDVKDSKVRPEYRQFFYFAFFFTIMHVVGMIVATVPKGSGSAVAFAAAYLVCAGVGLYILFKR